MVEYPGTRRDKDHAILYRHPWLTRGELMAPYFADIAFDLRLKAFTCEVAERLRFGELLKAVIHGASRRDAVAMSPPHCNHLPWSALLSILLGIAITEARHDGPGGPWMLEYPDRPSPEASGGGRFLFPRLALAIALDLLTAGEASQGA
jgi:hypothetical protein